MPACHTVVRGPARLTQKKITSNRQTTGDIRYNYGLLQFSQLPFVRREKPYRVIGHSAHPQRRLRAFIWQSWLPQPSSVPRPPLHRAANRYGTSVPGVSYHVGTAYFFIHSLGIQARLKKQDCFLSRTPTRNTSREEPLAGLIVKQVSEFLLLHILINLRKGCSPSDHGRNPQRPGTASSRRSPGIFPIGRKSAGTAETAQTNDAQIAKAACNRAVL